MFICVFVHWFVLVLSHSVVSKALNLVVTLFLIGPSDEICNL